MSEAGPTRTCIGCGRKDSKHNLTRIVLALLDRKIELDRAKCRPGRGAYLHQEADCVQRGLAARRLARAFRGQFAVSEELEDVVMTATERVAM